MERLIFHLYAQRFLSLQQKLIAALGATSIVMCYTKLKVEQF